MLPNLEFDRDLNIHDVLEKIDGEKLIQSLSLLSGSPLLLLDEKKNTLVGDNIEKSDLLVQPVVLELEPIGYLASIKKEGTSLLHANTVLCMVFRNVARYIMTSDLHLQAVREDYALLSEKHTALQQSEDKYRELSAGLENRVQEQVRTIESAQRQLYQAEKMASVGQLAAGVAHEINNPIGYIQSNLNMARNYLALFANLKDCLADPDPAFCLKDIWSKHDLDFVYEDFQALLTESIDGAARVTRIVKNLKDFSNVDATEFDNISPDDIIRNVLSVAEFELDNESQILIALGDVPSIHCQPGHLAQVFMNILLNAANVIDKNGEISISSGIDDNMIRIDIKDNGPGIAADVLNRVFDPFFTTRDVGEGTGLGLTVSRDIVRSHHGEIKISSAPGRGTLVSVLLPLSTKDNTHEDG